MRTGFHAYETHAFVRLSKGLWDISIDPEGGYVISGDEKARVKLGRNLEAVDAYPGLDNTVAFLSSEATRDIWLVIISVVMGVLFAIRYRCRREASVS